MVKPENRVRRRSVYILHDGADTVVAPGVGTSFGTAGHVSEVVGVVAGVHEVGVGVGGLAVVVVTGEAMVLVACTGSDVDAEVGELLLNVS